MFSEVFAGPDVLEHIRNDESSHGEDEGHEGGVGPRVVMVVI